MTQKVNPASHGLSKIHYHKCMEAHVTEDRHRTRKVVQIVAAVLVVLVLAGITAFAWKAQGRTKEDTSFAMRRARHHDAQEATSLLPMVDRYEKLMFSLAGLQYGTPQWVSSNRQLTELENLIGEADPALIWHKDQNGNVVLVSPEMARNHLRAVIALDKSNR